MEIIKNLTNLFNLFWQAKGGDNLWEDENAVTVTVKFTQHRREKIQLAAWLDQRASFKHAVW